MTELENQFDYKIIQIKANDPRASEDCMNILREMNNTPSYGLGEMQPILNEKINSYCRVSGESFEKVAMEMSMPKLKF